MLTVRNEVAEFFAGCCKPQNIKIGLLPRFCILNDNPLAKVAHPDFPVVFDNDILAGGAIHHVCSKTLSHRCIMRRKANADKIVVPIFFAGMIDMMDIQHMSPFSRCSFYTQ